MISEGKCDFLPSKIHRKLTTAVSWRYFHRSIHGDFCCGSCSNESNWDTSKYLTKTAIYLKQNPYNTSVLKRVIQLKAIKLWEITMYNEIVGEASGCYLAVNSLTQYNQHSTVTPLVNKMNSNGIWLFSVEKEMRHYLYDLKPYIPMLIC